MDADRPRPESKPAEACRSFAAGVALARRPPRSRSRSARFAPRCRPGRRRRTRARTYPSSCTHGSRRGRQRGRRRRTSRRRSPAAGRCRRRRPTPTRRTYRHAHGDADGRDPHGEVRWRPVEEDRVRERRGHVARGSADRRRARLAGGPARAVVDAALDRPRPVRARLEADGQLLAEWLRAAADRATPAGPVRAAECHVARAACRGAAGIGGGDRGRHVQRAHEARPAREDERAGRSAIVLRRGDVIRVGVRPRGAGPGSSRAPECPRCRHSPSGRSSTRSAVRRRRDRGTRPDRRWRPPRRRRGR